MRRRQFIHAMAAASAMAGWPPVGSRIAAQSTGAVSVDELPPLEGELTLYLGRGEGGLYENVLQAIEDRNPNLDLG
ncbi:MAG: ABC transporter substrate-binding protein, partial [Thiotrichales bacterium]|nr:ABC transporter substrate-binding protein [Thiotrichales bacterium]